MLPANQRLRRSADFTSVVRTGRRARRGELVVHMLSRARGTASKEPEAPRSAHLPSGAPARVGLIVGKSVGGSVVRHRVSRRLRAQLALRADLLTGDCDVVVRALPGAADQDSRQLGSDLESALRAVASRGARQ